MIEVKIKAVLPTSGGCAVFLGNEVKAFIIYVDHAVGASISSFMQGLPSERPLTHDLIGSILNSLDTKIKNIIINEYKDGVYYARLIIESKNDRGIKQIVEIDARPSDTIALALRSSTPIHITQEVLDKVDNMRDILEKLGSKNIYL